MGAHATTEIGDGPKTADYILNETIAAVDIAAGAVTTSEILNETILSEDILDGTISATDIGTDAVGADEIISDAVSADELNVTGNGLLGQVLISDADGSFSWLNQSDIDPVMALEDLTNVGDDTETDGNVLIADGDSWESQTIGGDVLIDNTGDVQIQPGVVTTAEILDETILAGEIAIEAVTP